MSFMCDWWPQLIKGQLIVVLSFVVVVFSVSIEAVATPTRW